MNPTRRALLAGLAASPAAILGTRPSAAQEEAAAGAGLVSPSVCLLTPEVDEGPFYLDAGLLRSDITEGRPGLSMDLVVQVVDASCRPFAGARVDLWHCDALGIYSGVADGGSDMSADTSGATFLRGTQMTDPAGVATFQTIFPGWYRGRTTHMHHKVFLDERTVLTGQIFFPDSASDAVYAAITPYSSRAAIRDTLNDGDDMAVAAGKGAFAVIGEVAGRTVASIVMGVDPTAVSQRR